MCVCVCVCVCARVCMSVCVCVCVRARARVRVYYKLGKYECYACKVPPIHGAPVKRSPTHSDDNMLHSL